MTAIEFNNVSKQYRLGLVSTGTLTHDLNRFWQTKVLHREDPYLKIGETNDRASKGNSEYVWALRDIDFKVEQGDVVGIIGRNGAGKSTLLKLLSRVTSPTTGSIRARGRIASLLEVGTGFHPEMTGRENIYMNGSIMGMTRAEITRKLDEIVDFSGCERYLDTPVKRYSSGMSVRLGFAIAAHLEPEILVVDEVLAVGDAEFQKKAIGKMQDVSHGEGRTVLFVSHNMASIRALCKSGVVLDNGRIARTGTADYCIDYYTQANLDSEIAAEIGTLPRDGKCRQNLKFSNVMIVNEKDEPIDPHCGRPFRVLVDFDVKEPVHGVALTLSVQDPYDRTFLACNTDLTMPRSSFGCGRHRGIFEMKKLNLTEGKYKFSLHASSDEGQEDYVRSAMAFNVMDDDYYGLGRSIYAPERGKYVLCDHKWSFM